MSEIQTTHHSYWQSHCSDSSLQPRYPALTSNHKTDVAVIGGGITGLSTALELLRRGYKVSVFEAAVIGAGTTGGSSGHLDCHPEQGPVALLKRLGSDKARQYVALRAGAIGLIEERSDSATSFHRIPAYYYSEKTDDSHKLFEEFEAASRLDLRVEWDAENPYPGASCGYRIDGMARINSLAYLQGLANLVTEAGGEIFEQSFTCGPDKKQPDVLHVGEYEVTCRHIVCAVHCNYSSALRIDLQLPAYQSYVLAARVSNMPPDALYWDNNDPYFYTRWAGDEESQLLLIGGCDHRTGDGDPQEAYRKLEAYAQRHFQVQEILSRWSAELFEPTDGLPLIGAVPGYEHVWIAAGLSGIGLTWGTAAGSILADLITGRNVPLQEELSPSRFGWQGLTTMVAEQMTAVESYAQRILPADATDPQKLQPGDGKVGKVDGEFSAVCCDRENHHHRVSPICTHMGGVLRWNAAEQTWDCPVHGGRFTADGERLYGPPCKNLEKLDPEPSGQESQ